MPPKILGAKPVYQCPWLTVVEKAVDFGAPLGIQNYYSLKSQDYTAILCQRSDLKIPLVRQFRPAVERITLELPAGLMEVGETHEDCSRRELLEETGLIATQMTHLGSMVPDTGRNENIMHVFFARGDQIQANWKPEPGITVSWVSVEELKTLTLNGEFSHALHVAAFSLAILKGKLG